MSRLIRQLKFIETEKPGYFARLIEFIDDILYWRPNFYYRIKNYFYNFLFFNRLAWSYRSWDSYYAVQVFAELLKDNAKCCKNGHNVKSEQVYRRGMTMAGLLERAYNYCPSDDVSMCNFFEKNPRIFAPIEGSSLVQCIVQPKHSKEYSDKMWTIINKRTKDKEKLMKEEAWAYVHKYIEHLWD